MGSHPPRGAGEPVAGAAILRLFEELARELCRRHDGDGGALRAFESVEFLAPVHAGDLVEASGEIINVGRTSRTIRFTARRVATGPPEETPLVGRAVGVCVVPRDRQRASNG